MCSRFDDQLVQATLGDYSCKVADKDGMPSLQPTDVPDGVAPGELVSKFLTMMWETAETNVGADKKEMVVAVPHGASEEYKEALRAACTTAGTATSTLFLDHPSRGVLSAIPPLTRCVTLSIHCPC